jgi:adenosylmethionine-8-amino-7-oxononanoate aminotransferase
MQPETQTNINRIVSKHQEFAIEIANNSKLKNIRQQGTIIALEWDIEATSYFNNIRDTLYNFFLSKNILLRPLGNILYIMPPYCISNDDLDYIYNNIKIALSKF